MHIETERLVIRDLHISDAEDIYEYAKGNIVGPLAGFIPHKSVEETRSIINDVLKVNTFSIVLKKENKVIGLISLSTIIDRVFELGYSLNDKYWNKGFMSEAVKALIDYAFKNGYADEIDAGCSLTNTRSENVLKKAGFTYIGIVKENHVFEKNRETKRFRLLKNDYMEV